MDDADDGLIGKIGSGRVDQLCAKDAASAAENFGGYIPGLPGQVVSAIGAGASGGFSSEEELAELEKAGIRLRTSASPAAKRKLRALENRPYERFKHVALVGAASLFGGFVGATLLSALPLPFMGLVGGLIGTFVAGYIAEQIYSGTCAPHEQDGMKLITETFGKQRKRQKVSEYDTACLMLANMPEKAQKKYEDLLEKKIGTRNFAEALKRKDDGDGQCIDAIVAMMHDPVLEDTLRATYGIPVDVRTSVYKQLAAMLNDPQNRLDVRDIVLNPDRVAEIANDRNMLAMQRLAAMPQDTVMPPQQFPPNLGRAAGGPARSA